MSKALLRLIVAMAIGMLLLVGIVKVFANEREFCEVTLIDNPFAQNVNYARLMEFLEQDKVNENTYVRWEYDCRHFSSDLHNNAEKAGIRCAVVLTPDKKHIFNAFKTTDKGILFVDVSTNLDSVAYQKDGILVVDVEITEGVADSAIQFLGDPEKFIIEW